MTAFGAKRTLGRPGRMAGSDPKRTLGGDLLFGGEGKVGARLLTVLLSNLETVST